MITVFDVTPFGIIPLGVTRFVVTLFMVTTQHRMPLFGVRRLLCTGYVVISGGSGDTTRTQEPSVSLEGHLVMGCAERVIS